MGRRPIYRSRSSIYTPLSGRLRGALALLPAVAVAKAIRATEAALAAAGAAQHTLPLEADDPAPPAA